MTCLLLKGATEWFGAFSGYLRNRPQTGDATGLGCTGKEDPLAVEEVVVLVASEQSLVEVAEVANSNKPGPGSVPVLCVRT